MKLFKKLESKVCEYFEGCNVAKISGRNCADYKNCQTYKYNQRYGNEVLGIGGMTEIPGEWIFDADAGAAYKRKKVKFKLIKQEK